MAATPSRIRPLVAGNWKMNGLDASLGEALRVRDRLGEAGFAAGVDAMICPPATLIAALARETAGSRLLVGGQDCHVAVNGAHTGDISAEMLKDAGASAVIVGHSERRAEHGERDRDVKAKALAAHRAGLMAIVCIGETAGERRAGLTLEVVARQLAASLPDNAKAGDTVVAYEPVWAIGTGRTATSQQADAAQAFIRARIAAKEPGVAGRLPILYGGSVKAASAAELFAMPNVDGGLVGGASLVSEEFVAIWRAAGAPAVPV
jgi:triosephosphate isomerase